MRVNYKVRWSKKESTCARVRDNVRICVRERQKKKERKRERAHHKKVAGVKISVYYFVGFRKEVKVFQASLSLFRF